MHVPVCVCVCLPCSFPIFENPYPMDIHESPVTCTAYFADCPPDIIPILYSIGAKHKKTGYSQKVCCRGGVWVDFWAESSLGNSGIVCVWRMHCSS